MIISSYRRARAESCVHPSFCNLPHHTLTELQAVLQNLNQFFSPNTDKTKAADVVRHIFVTLVLPELTLLQVIYCDLSRYQKREDGLIYDPDIDQAEAKPGITDGCNLLSTTLAYTVTQKNPRKVQQIQICPWYLNLVATSEYQFVSSADFTTRLKGWIAKAFNKVSTWQGSLTTMDAVALFDHTLLHEVSARQLVDFIGSLLTAIG